MGFFLFLILAIVIFGVMMILSLIKGVGSFIFGKPSSSSFSGYRANNSYAGTEQEHHASKNRQKVFSKDEGEYVKFEEIKD